MSAAKGSNTRTIYIPLRDEGVLVSRPTEGVVLPGDRFLVLATPDHDAEAETWAFPPGTTVTCDSEASDGGDILMAREPVSQPDRGALGRVAADAKWRLRADAENT
jgi:hypothetical protein